MSFLFSLLSLVALAGPGIDGAKHTKFSSVFYEKAKARPGIIEVSRGKETKKIQVKDLTEVKVITTDKGPMVDDVFWLLTTKNGTRFLVSNFGEQIEDMMAELQKLPGFDNEKTIKAMGTATNAEFVLWTKGKK